MNIFIFDPDLKKSAEYFFANDFKRANKQILESTQLLAHGCNKWGFRIPHNVQGEPYKLKGHKNHPVTQWVLKDFQRFVWLWIYTKHLCSVFKTMKGKKHKCSQELELMEIMPFLLMQQVEPEFFGKEEYLYHPYKVHNGKDVYEKYILYLKNKQHRRLNEKS